MDMENAIRTIAKFSLYKHTFAVANDLIVRLAIIGIEFEALNNNPEAGTRRKDSKISLNF